MSGLKRTKRTIRAWQAVFLLVAVGGIPVAASPGGGGFAAAMIGGGVVGFFALVGIVGYHKPPRS